MMKISHLVDSSISETISYYVRLVAWIGFLVIIIEILTFVNSTTVHSIRAVICYLFLLIVLVYLKIYKPALFDNFKWFTAPGNLFLKSWISLFFYAYLIRLPMELLPIRGPQIVSWLGNSIGVLLSSLCLSSVLGIVRRWHGGKVDMGDFDPNDNNDDGTNPTDDTLNNIELNSVTNIEAKSPKAEELSVTLESTGSPIVDSDVPSSAVQVVKPALRITSGRNCPPVESELDDTIRDIGASFSVMRGSRMSGRYTTSMELRLTISRASTIRSEVKKYLPPISQDISTTLTPIRESLASNGGDLGRASLAIDTAAAAGNSNFTGPFVPNMSELLMLWMTVMVFSVMVNYLSPAKTHVSTVAFQLSASMIVFISTSLYRAKILEHAHWFLQSFFQAVVFFAPTVIVIVILSSQEGHKNWVGGLYSYQTNRPFQAMQEWGAGDFLIMMIRPAIVALAFSTVDAIIAYSKLLPLLIPVIWVVCMLLILQACGLSALLHSPKPIALSMLTRTVTTPIAVSIAELTGANPSISAASTIISGLFSYRTVPYVLTMFRMSNPITRGVTAALTGTLMGVVAMDENEEEMAAGIGMAAFGVCTCLYAFIFTIYGFRYFLAENA